VKQCVVLTLSLALSVSTVAGAASGALVTFPLRATAPTRGTVNGLMNRTFTETVTCLRACKVRTKVVIKAKVARQLGFTNVKGKYVAIATNRATLRARTPTKLPFLLTREARRRLPRANVVAIFGGVQGFPTGGRGVNYSVAWTSRLT